MYDAKAATIAWVTLTLLVLAAYYLYTRRRVVVSVYSSGWRNTGVHTLLDEEMARRGYIPINAPKDDQPVQTLKYYLAAGTKANPDSIWAVYAMFGLRVWRVEINGEIL